MRKISTKSKERGNRQDLNPGYLSTTEAIGLDLVPGLSLGVRLRLRSEKLELGIWVESDGLARIDPIFWRVGP